MVQAPRKGTSPDQEVWSVAMRILRFGVVLCSVHTSRLMNIDHFLFEKTQSNLCRPDFGDVKLDET